MLLQSLLALPVPLLQGWVLDRIVPVLGGARPAEVAPHGGLIAGALAASVLCLLARAALAWKVAAVMARVSLEIVRDLTDALHRKLQRLPMAYFDGQQTGRLMARVTNDVGSLLIFLSSGSLQLVSDLVLASGIAVVLLWLQWQLAAVAFLVLPFYALTQRRFAGVLRSLTASVRGELAAVYALLSERVSAVRVVRSFVREESEIAEFDRRIDAHREFSRAAAGAGALQGAVAVLLAGAGTAAVLTWGVIRVRGGNLTVGELLAFYALVALLYAPIVRLSQFQGVAAATLVAADRVGEVLEEPEPARDLPGALPVRRARGSLRFHKVTFAYRPGGPRVLDGVDLVVEPGMTVGLLGPSGAGKSTLLALAPRLYELPEGHGTVLLDGHDVRGLRLADLRRAVALVPQQALLFEGTLRSNLAYAAPRASARRVRRALEVSDLTETVASLPDGLDTRVGERGVSLSGGQRQRVALARAILADPAVLLLDDCLSALDAETEDRVRTAMARFLPGRTRVIVSHKVASVRDADWIVVLDAGRITEQGSHETLLAAGGVYATTLRQQARPLALGGSFSAA
jgi:ABC-type multidrug transport system fused ATPase/permease subunit